MTDQVASNVERLMSSLIKDFANDERATSVEVSVLLTETLLRLRQINHQEKSGALTAQAADLLTSCIVSTYRTALEATFHSLGVILEE